MTLKRDNLKNLSKKSTSNWRKEFEYRLANKWLNYSSEIARRIAATIEDDEELNQRKLAKLLEVSPQQISKILKGHENLTLETIYKISKALNVELITFPEYKYSFSAIDKATVKGKAFEEEVYKLLKEMFSKEHSATLASQAKIVSLPNKEYQTSPSSSKAG